MAFKKYREERDTYEMSFTRRLSTGETLSAPEVTVLYGVLGELFDVSDEFVTGASVVSDRVQFLLKEAATDAEQPAGKTYTVMAKVHTSADRILVGKADLIVME